MSLSDLVVWSILLFCIFAIGFWTWFGYKMLTLNKIGNKTDKPLSELNKIDDVKTFIEWLNGTLKWYNCLFELELKDGKIYFKDMNDINPIPQELWTCET